jgi:hypothetical protein
LIAFKRTNYIYRYHCNTSKIRLATIFY